MDLVLSALMAVTMLTACGGSGVKTVSVDRGEIEELFEYEGYEINVTTSNEAATAAKQVAELIREKDYGAITRDFLSAELAARLPQGVVGMYMLAPQADMEANSITVEALAAATISSLYSAGFVSNDYGVAVVDVTTADKVACYLSVAVVQ